MTMRDTKKSKKTKEPPKPCPVCGSTQTIKHGRPNGMQKYKCQNESCDIKYFLEEKKRIRYSDREKKFLSMLLNFLRDKGYNGITIKEAVEKIDANFPEVSKFRLNHCIKKFNTPTTKPTKNTRHFLRDKSKKAVDESLTCYNPRLLICEDDKNIILYRFQERTSEDGESRKIVIIDSDEYKNIIYSDISY